MLLTTTVALLGLWGRPYIGDELAHAKQIEWFKAGNFKPLALLSVYPTYHWIITILSYPINSLDYFRVITALLSMFLVIPTFYYLSKKDYRKTLQLYFIPIFFVFHILVYSDIVSLGLVLLTYLMLRKNKFIPASLLGILAVMVRQNNVIWIAYLIAVEFFMKPEFRAKEFLKKLWPMYAGLAVVFWYILGHGIVPGDTARHPLAIHFGNLWFFMLIMPLVFMPLFVYMAPEVYKAIKKHTAIYTVFTVSIVALGLITFNSTHLYNSYYDIWFNLLLFYIMKYMILKIIVLLIITYSIITVAEMYFDTQYVVLWIPATVAFLAVSWLIEPRYYIIPMVLFQLYRDPMPAEYENYLTIYLVIISCGLYLML